MKIVGLTGGIGSGKTFVASYFKNLQIPVYFADDEAKKLMHNEVITRQIIQLFGADAYQKGQLNRAYISNIVFKNKEKLDQLNQIVHPAVAQHFKHWVEANTPHHPYVIKEAAILFESGSDKDCDFTITVSAPLELRIERVMQRDLVDRDAVLDRINKQLTDEERRQKADFIIFADEQHDVAAQVMQIHEQIKTSI